MLLDPCDDDLIDDGVDQFDDEPMPSTMDQTREVLSDKHEPVDLNDLPSHPSPIVKTGSLTPPSKFVSEPRYIPCLRGSRRIAALHSDFS
jgi:hypothetical protein